MSYTDLEEKIKLLTRICLTVVVSFVRFCNVDETNKTHVTENDKLYPVCGVKILFFLLSSCFSLSFTNTH